MGRATRIPAIVMMAAALVGLAAVPALAKGAPGEDPAVRMVMVTGPHISAPAVFSGSTAMDLAQAAGMVQAAGEIGMMGTISSVVPVSLGPKFTLSYVFNSDVSHALGRDGVPVTQELYPYAHGGPWAFTPPGQGLRGSGWWPVASSILQTLRAGGLALLRADGPAAPPSVPAGDGWPLGAWIAIGIVALIPLADLAVGGRRRSMASAA